jgi:hypothetical protein
MVANARTFNEKKDDYLWYFELLKNKSGAVPRVTVSDQMPVITLALDRVFHASAHLKCGRAYQGELQEG